MMKFKNLFLVLLIASNAHAFAGKKPIVEPTPSATPVATASPAPSGQDKVTFTPVDYYTTKAQRVKIASASHHMNQVIQSACAHDFLAKRKLIQTKGKTNEQVADDIQSLSGVIPVEMYNPDPFSSAIAYRQPPSNTIHLSYKYFSTAMTDCEWAKTLAHESVGHSLGNYEHDFKWNPQRSFSVPYSLGGADAAQGGDLFDACDPTCPKR